MSLASRAESSEFIITERGDIEVRDAVIIWKNFEGRDDKGWNSSHIRQFNLVLSDEMADKLRNEGWNVKSVPARNEGDDPFSHINISVYMDSKWPPEINLYSEFNGKKTKRRLDANTISELDNLQFESADLVIHPRDTKRDFPKFKGYLNKLNVIASPNMDFGGKYANWESGDDEVVNPF